MFSERAGVVNIGLEGMMLMGAFFGDPRRGQARLLVVGHRWRRCSRAALLALIHAFFSIHLRADQIVSGTAINFLALGVTGYLFLDVYGDQGTPGEASRASRT